MPLFTEAAQAKIEEAHEMLSRPITASRGKDQLDITQAHTFIYLAEQLAILTETLQKIEAHLAVLAVPFYEATQDQKQPTKTTTRTKRG